MQYVINLLREEHDEDDAAIEEPETVATFILDLPAGADTEREVAAFERDLFQQLEDMNALPGAPYVFYTTYAPLLATVTNATDGATVARAGLAHHTADAALRRRIWSPGTTRENWSLPIAEHLRANINSLQQTLAG